MSHPLHPAMVHVPIGLWIGALVFDLCSRFAHDATGPFFVMASFYSILLGVLVAVPTAVTGLAEFTDIPHGSRARRLARLHMGMNLALVVGYVAQLILRDPSRSVVETWIFLLNIMQALGLGFSGYLGGRLVFEQHVGIRELKREPVQIRRVA